VATRNALYRLFPHKVSIVNYYRLDRDFTNDEIFVALCSVKNGKSPRIDGFPCEFYKAMWDIVGDDFSCLVFEAFSIGCLMESLN
jgi:hypothetical protein